MWRPQWHPWGERCIFLRLHACPSAYPNTVPKCVWLFHKWNFACLWSREIITRQPIGLRTWWAARFKYGPCGNSALVMSSSGQAVKKVLDAECKSVYCNCPSANYCIIPCAIRQKKSSKWNPISWMNNHGVRDTMRWAAVKNVWFLLRSHPQNETRSFQLRALFMPVWLFWQD